MVDVGVQHWTTRKSLSLFSLFLCYFPYFIMSFFIVSDPSANANLWPQMALWTPTFVSSLVFGSGSLGTLTVVQHPFCLASLSFEYPINLWTHHSKAHWPIYTATKISPNGGFTRAGRRLCQPCHPPPRNGNPSSFSVVSTYLTLKQ